MKNFALTLLLLLCAVTSASAYEYVFDWSKIQIDHGSAGGGTTYPETPTNGIDLYIHGTRELQSTENLMIYAWLDNGEKIFGDWPGEKLTVVGDLKKIAKSSDLENATEFFKVHFDLTDVNFIISVNGGQQTADLALNEAGSFFFQYDRYDSNNTKQLFDYYSDGEVLENFLSTSGDHPTIYARIMDGATFTPTIYWWNTWEAGPDWNNPANHHEMEPVVIKGQTWYKYFINQYYLNSATL